MEENIVHHTFVDHYSTQHSPIHHWDARLKLATLVLATALGSSLPQGSFLAIMTLICMSLAAAFFAQIPPALLVKRVLTLGSFIVLMGISQLWLVNNQIHSIQNLILFLLLRSIFLVITLTVLTATTRFSDLLGALAWYKIPSTITAVLAFVYRFIFVIAGEAEQLSIARNSRLFGTRRWLAWQSYIWMIGTLLVRSIERASRVYDAMCARGHHGSAIAQAPHTGLPGTQSALTTVLIALLIAIRIYLGKGY